MSNTLCMKCGAKYGLMFEDELGIHCTHCHPTSFSSFNSPEEILSKMEKLNIFKRTADRIYQSDNMGSVLNEKYIQKEK